MIGPHVAEHPPRNRGGSNSAPGSSRNFITAIVGNLFPPLAALGTAPILAHALGVDGRGQVAGATAPLLLVLASATFGLPEASTYAIARFPRVARWVALRGTLLVFAAGIVATLAVIALSPVLSDGVEVVQKNLVIASLAITPSLLVALLRGVTMGMHRWTTVAVSRAGDAGFRLLMITILWSTQTLDVTTATMVIAASPLIGGLLLLRTLRSLPRPSDREHESGRATTLMSYGVRIWIGAISGVLLLRLDQVLLTPLGGSYALGLYVVAVAISEVPLIVNSAVRDVTFASDAAEADANRLGLASRLSTLVTASIAAVLAATLTWWLPIVFGADFAPAAPVALILLLAVTAGNSGSVAGAGLSARGRPGLRSLSLMIAACINVIALIILVPPLGATGAAWATCIGNVLASNLNIFFLWRKFGISPTQFYAFRVSDIQLLIRTLWKLLKR